MQDGTVRHLKYAALAAVPLSFAGVLLSSPYRGAPTPLISESVEIARPCLRVVDYLANSAHASEWSAFVSHITPLNAEIVPDGAQGSIRRSFRNSDETGMRWDEYFLEVTPLRRRLRVYNVVGAPLRATTLLLTEQIYEPVDANRCRLSFTLFFGEDPSLGDRLRLRLGAHLIAPIFRRNIGNIKQLVEAP
ncbi:MAG: hypothetical protein BMS9Abin29_2113 [Gemmatimonadota bacterium]|nr:MAG: hypothetical protein BMS9Abin29_2113 [Gemmatimonadota bacterium]